MLYIKNLSLSKKIISYSSYDKNISHLIRKNIEITKPIGINQSEKPKNPSSKKTAEAQLINDINESKSPGLMVMLGEDYLYGTNGINQNIPKAKKLFKRAANLGYSDGQYQYALVLLKTKTPENDKKAFDLALAAAKQGNADAMHLVGVLYSSDNGAPKDNHEALVWFKKSAEKGHAVSKHLYDTFINQHETATPNTEPLDGIKLDQIDVAQLNHRYLRLFFNSSSIFLMLMSISFLMNIYDSSKK